MQWPDESTERDHNNQEKEKKGTVLIRLSLRGTLFVTKSRVLDSAHERDFEKRNNLITKMDCFAHFIRSQ
jgi:hypothetical protein